VTLFVCRVLRAKVIGATSSEGFLVQQRDALVQWSAIDALLLSTFGTVAAVYQAQQRARQGVLNQFCITRCIMAQMCGQQR